MTAFGRIFFPLGPLFLPDQDQRNTLNLGADAVLPWRSYASKNVYYGSASGMLFPDSPGDPGRNTAASRFRWARFLEKNFRLR